MNKYPVVNIHDFSSHSSNSCGQRADQRDRLKVRFWLVPRARTATSWGALKVAGEGFRGQPPTAARGDREKERDRDLRAGTDSPDVSRRVLLHPRARSRTFVSRSNPPLSFVPAFPGDLRDRIPGLADGFQCRQEDGVSCSAKCVIIRACTNCTRVSVMQFRSSAACTCGLNNERPPYTHEALVCVHKGLRIRGFSKRTYFPARRN